MSRYTTTRQIKDAAGKRKASTTIMPNQNSNNSKK